MLLTYVELSIGKYQIVGERFNSDVRTVSVILRP